MRKIDEKCGTTESALNQFRQRIVFGNVYKCFLCSCFKCSDDVVEVDEVEVIDVADSENLNNLNVLKRNGKFWKCNGCDSPRSFKSPEVTNVQFSRRETDNTTVFIPMLKENEDLDVEVDQQSLDKQIQVFLPSSVDSLQFYDEVPAKTSKNMELLLYRGTSFGELELKVLYQNQLSKFKSAKLNSDLYLAKLQPGEDKKLSSVKPQTNQSHIQGSDMWKLSRQSDRSAMMNHLGLLCVKLEIKVPLVSDEVVSSCLIQDGVAVTASHESNQSHELATKYQVHEGMLFRYY